MKKSAGLLSLCLTFLAGSFVGSCIGAQSAFESLRSVLGPFGPLLQVNDVFALIVPPAMKASVLAVVIVAPIYAAMRGERFLFPSASRASDRDGTSGRD